MSPSAVHGIFELVSITRMTSPLGILEFNAIFSHGGFSIYQKKKKEASKSGQMYVLDKVIRTLEALSWDG